MATLLKPVKEKPAKIQFFCPQALAARLKNLEQLASQRGVEVDVNAPLSAALERLISRAEKQLQEGRGDDGA
jgi:hypothetical protein